MKAITKMSYSWNTKREPFIARTYRISKEHDKIVKRMARKFKVSESEIIRVLILHEGMRLGFKKLIKVQK